MHRRIDEGRRRRRIILYSVPLLALALLLGIYYVATVSPQPAIDFRIPIAIQLVQLIGGSPYLQPVVPKYVGVVGGIWATHQYDSYGLNGHYPIFTQEGTNGNLNYSFIHIRSTVGRNYTLQDFFNIYGQPLGPKNTLGFTVPPSASENSTYVKYGSDWFWQMCVTINGGPFHPGLWGNQTIVPGEAIILRYSDDGCLSPA